MKKKESKEMQVKHLNGVPHIMYCFQRPGFIWNVCKYGYCYQIEYKDIPIKMVFIPLSYMCTVFFENF